MDSSVLIRQYEQM